MLIEQKDEEISWALVLQSRFFCNIKQLRYLLASYCCMWLYKLMS